MRLLYLKWLIIQVAKSLGCRSNETGNDMFISLFVTLIQKALERSQAFDHSIGFSADMTSKIPF